MDKPREQFRTLSDNDWARISNMAHEMAVVTPAQHRKQVWAKLALELPDDIRAKVDTDYTPNELRQAFESLRPEDYGSVSLCLDDSFYAVRILKGDDVADDVLQRSKDLFRDLEALSPVDMEDFGAGHRTRFAANFEKSLRGHLDDDVSAVLFKLGKGKTIIDVLPDYITDAEWQFEGEHHPWNVFREKKGDEIADLVTKIAKKTFIEGLYARRSAEHIVDDIREKLSSIGLPEEDQAVLFKGSFASSCLMLLPQDFDKREQTVLDNFPLANKDGEKIVARYEMPNLRLSSGGFASAMAASAGDNGPGPGQRYHANGGPSKRTGRANREPDQGSNDLG